jgi:predicted dienelactone hydrolase
LLENKGKDPEGMLTFKYMLKSNQCFAKENSQLIPLITYPHGVGPYKIALAHPLNTGYARLFLT